MASSSDNRDRDPTSAAPQSENPFIKFRQFADKQVGSLLQGIVGLPSAFSKRSSEDNGRWADIDEDLRRRDEMQARRRELIESENERGTGQTSDRIVIPVKKSLEVQRDTHIPVAQHGSPEDVTGDLPLYSPVTKSLFKPFQQPDDYHVDWEQTDDTLDGQSMFSGDYDFSYFPFRMKHSQLSALAAKNSLDIMDITRYMVYNEVNSSPIFRSQYSLLPYIMFSPYSPMKLSMDIITSKGGGAVQDGFPYCEAFKDLIETTQEIPRPTPFSYVMSALPSMFSADKPKENVSWLYSLYSCGLLQQKETRSLTGTSLLREPFPFPMPVTSEKLGESPDGVQTEQDMYDRFLREHSDAPKAPADDSDMAIISSMVKGMFGSTQIEELRKLAAQEFKKFGEMLDDDKGSMPPKVKEVEDTSIRTRIASKDPRDANRVVSTSTTTQRSTEADGSVLTSVTVWKQYADGRETTTTSTHCDEPPYRHEAGEDKSGEQAVKTGDKKGKGNGHKGWFWN